MPSCDFCKVDCKDQLKSYVCKKASYCKQGVPGEGLEDPQAIIKLEAKKYAKNYGDALIYYCNKYFQ